MKFVFALFLISAAIIVQAQPKPQYTASVEAGLARGSSDKSSVYFFSNGISYKQFYTGIGAGIDKYALHSIPLFFDAKKEFGKHKVKPFVDASAGINLPHLTTEQRNSYGGWNQNSAFKNGFFTKTSVGISMPVLHNLRLFMNAGYSYKTTSIKVVNDYRPFDGDLTTTTDIYRYNRWFAAIGFQL